MIIQINVEYKKENISSGSFVIGQGRTPDGRKVEISQSGVFINLDITQKDLLVHQYRFSLKDILAKIMEQEGKKHERTPDNSSRNKEERNSKKKTRKQ